MTNRCRCTGTTHTCGIQNVVRNPGVIYVGQGGPKGAQGAQGVQGPSGAGTQGVQGTQGLQGLQGQAIQGATGTAVTILGSYNSYSELVAAHPTGNTGDGYLVNGDLYIWDGTSWVNVGNISGPQGVQGVQGIQGVDGGGVTLEQLAEAISAAALTSTDDLPEGLSNLYYTPGRVSYVHTQGVASDTWVIPHNLGFHPNLTVQDSAGTIYEGEITYTNLNSLTVTFSAAFSGTAYLS